MKFISKPMMILNINILKSLIFVIGVYSSMFVLPAAYADNKNDAQELKSCGTSHGPLISTQTFQLPPKELEMEVEMGQSMVSTFNINVMDGVRSHRFPFDSEIKFSGTSFGVRFDVAVPPSAGVLHEGNKIYKPTDYTFKYENDSSPRTGFSKPDLYFTLDLPTGNVIATVKIGFGVDVQVGVAPVNVSAQCTMTSIDSFKRELIYSGVSQGTISILYREFMNDMARPAFSQELRYDLKDGDEIGYKGARFKVIKANNTGMKFKVIKHLL